jgi:hypothetical protein
VKRVTVYDWEKIRAQVESGTPIPKVAALHGCAVTGIYRRRKREGWTPVPSVTKDKIVAQVNKQATDTDKITGKPIPKGRSIGQPMGELGADDELRSQFGAVTGLSAPEAGAVLNQAATEIQVMREHRRVISRASVVAENILTRLHALVVDGVASDVITFKTKNGEAYHRVPFLGDRESVSDALIKCANTISKLIPLERQAHGLVDQNKSDELPRVTFNMPDVKVISVDGHGKVVKAEDRPAPIEGTATAMQGDGQAAKH